MTLIPKSKFKKRKSKKGKRGERDGDDGDFIAALHSLVCCVCHSHGVEAHHLRGIAFGRGMGLKSLDKYAIPLCNSCHTDTHLSGTKMERQDLASKAGFDPVMLAEALWAKWLERKNVDDLIEEFYSWI